MHVATPHPSHVRGAQQHELVQQALLATRNVCNSIAKAGGVNTLVYTSSVVAVCDAVQRGVVYTEEDWNTEATLKRQPYSLSKVQTEREVWSWSQQHPTTRVVSLNPSMILGPELGPRVNTSNAFIAGLFTDKYAGVLAIACVVVDVRDVALAHVRAMEAPDAAGRYILAAGTHSMRELIDLCVQADPSLAARAPKRDLSGTLGRAMLTMASYVLPDQDGVWIRLNMPNSLYARFDSSKAQRDLRMQWRPISDTVRDVLRDVSAKDEM